eukprot:Gb_02750 [translate_table: standard]
MRRPRNGGDKGVQRIPSKNVGVTVIPSPEEADEWKFRHVVCFFHVGKQTLLPVLTTSNCQMPRVSICPIQSQVAPLQNPETNQDIQRRICTIPTDGMHVASAEHCSVLYMGALSPFAPTTDQSTGIAICIN